MVERKSSSRIGNTAAMKARTKSQEDYILLARGLSARLTGANTPLAPLTAEEMERDLRHMEAFSNACTSYAQQYYIFTNQNNTNAKENNGNDGTGPSNNLQQHGGGRSGAASGSYRNGQVPIIAMPVRIDPEEEKRLQTLRQKIQQCEAQREVYEGQYLSLRAHYISLSKKLKAKRDDVDSRVAFLQDQVKKRGRLLALQRVRIQMVRETLQILRHRLTNPSAPASLKTKEDQADLHTIWTHLDQQWKDAEDNINKSNGSSSKDMVANWPASKIPKIPPGVLLLLSQLGLQPGNAVAWGTCGAFGAKPDSLVWIENQVPTKRPDRSRVLPGLRDDVARLKREIAREQSLNRQFQSNAIKMRKQNDELVSMMTLLRSETEAVVARHNVLLESEEAKKASQMLFEEEAMVTSIADTAHDGNKKKGGAAAGLSSSDGSRYGNGAESGGKSVPQSSGLKEDDENDGDDEGGGEEDEDEGEIYEGREGKRLLEEETDSSRSKRRKI
eukprot:CAMPEP_0197185082 /NCGR_PEP_ID=MMETSP1423-20130617/11126_1 /TAXON_ID=476441 /ORGANISM="Pseudo-nitzschia heimii, Strain UNC1101" /LENGTH=500 /DNA_ID=CAMNT_0042636045 /DNA_START=106 /DNA_END=1608 /DNA_ORIENTATION=-